MTAAVVQLLCTMLVTAAAVIWTLLAVKLGRTVRDAAGGASRTVATLLPLAVGLLVVRAILVGTLASVSVAFAEDRVFGLALSAVMTGLAVVVIMRRGQASAAVAGGAALAAGGELVLTLVVGAPVPLWAATLVVVAVVVGTAAWTLGLLHVGRRPRAATIAAGAVAVLSLAVVGGAGVVGPGALGVEGFQGHLHTAEGTGAADGTAGTGAGASTGSASGGEAAATGEDAAENRVDPAAPRVTVRLRAQQEEVQLASGGTIDAWTFGALAGPAITATVGEVLDLRLDNIDIANGVTAHWHGYPVPAEADGVAGVTQDAVAPGGTFRTSFPLDRAGTYWYHTHQLGSEAVVRGLYGTLVVLPASGAVADVDVVLPVHTFGRTVVLGTDSGAAHTPAAEGQTVRARLVNTDQHPQGFRISGAAFRVVAIDGAEVQTGRLEGVKLLIPAGGRYDIEFTMPADPVAVRAEASATAVMVFAPSALDPPPAVAAERTFDPLTEVIAATAPDDVADGVIARAAASARFDVDETYVLDRLPRLVHGVPQYAYTVNGAVYPHIPSTIVDEGDVVRLTVVNRGFETHPMHPHGHSVRVLAVDGVAPAAPLWLDTFDVAPGEVWEVAFVADNPGIWMDHCHNLEHAALGMVLHIAYRGVGTPFESGGDAGNAPE